MLLVHFVLFALSVLSFAFLSFRLEALGPIDIKPIESQAMVFLRFYQSPLTRSGFGVLPGYLKVEENKTLIFGPHLHSNILLSCSTFSSKELQF